MSDRSPPKSTDLPASMFFMAVAGSFMGVGTDTLMKESIWRAVVPYLVGVAFFILGVSWHWLKQFVGQRFRDSVAKVSTDFRWWLAIAFIVFLYSAMPTIFGSPAAGDRALQSEWILIAFVIIGAVCLTPLAVTGSLTLYRYFQSLDRVQPADRVGTPTLTIGPPPAAPEVGGAIAAIEGEIKIVKRYILQINSIQLHVILDRLIEKLIKCSVEPHLPEKDIGLGFSDIKKVTEAIEFACTEVLYDLQSTEYSGAYKEVLDNAEKDADKSLLRVNAPEGVQPYQFRAWYIARWKLLKSMEFLTSRQNELWHELRIDRSVLVEQYRNIQSTF